MAKKTNYNKKKQYPVRRLFNNLFNISQDEFPLVLLFFFYFTTIGLFYTIGVSAGEAMLLSRFNAIKIENLLPWLYIGIASVSVLIIWFYDILQNRIDRLKIYIINGAGFTIFLLSGWNPVLFYLLCSSFPMPEIILPQEQRGVSMVLWPEGRPLALVLPVFLYLPLFTLWDWIIFSIS
ncbi:hypothetical protein ES705_45997 [subsurface metagenome]